LFESRKTKAVDWAANILGLHPVFEKSQLYRKEGGFYAHLSEFGVDTFQSAGEAERLLFGTSKELDVCGSS
jgi:hypothetical protein